jgi:hypothetical protein
MTLRARLVQREVMPFFAYMGLLAAATLLIDGLLHVFNIVWIGRYLGIPGTLLILLSFRYSLRKRKLIRSGNPAQLLRRHEYLAWTGSLMVMVHAGVHFNSILAWLAIAAMLVNVLSGLTGKFLLERSRRRVDEARERMREQGLSASELEELSFWDTLTFDAVRQWRVVHLPITLAFGGLALAHILAVFLFWGWK